MQLRISRPSVVVLVGTTGSGKSTFARRVFRSSEVLSSDAMRGIVADDENDQAATDDAFDALHYLASIRLRAGRLTVIDATNVHPETRLEWVALARTNRVPAVAIVLDIAPRIARERNRTRPDRRVDDRVVTAQRAALTSSFRTLASEGFAQVYVLRESDEIDEATVDSTATTVDSTATTAPARARAPTSEAERTPARASAGRRPSSIPRSRSQRRS